MQEAGTGTREMRIDKKLDKIAGLLNGALEAMKKEDLEISPALHKKLATRWRAIDQGMVKLHRYRSLEAFWAPTSYR